MEVEIAKTLIINIGGLIATISNDDNSAITLEDDHIADLFANLEDGATAGQHDFCIRKFNGCLEWPLSWF